MVEPGNNFCGEMERGMRRRCDENFVTDSIFIIAIFFVILICAEIL